MPAGLNGWPSSTTHSDSADTMSRSSSPPPDSASSAGSKEPDVTILDSRRPQFKREAADRLAKPQPQRPPQQPLAQPDRDPMSRLEALFDSPPVRQLLPAPSTCSLSSQTYFYLMPPHPIST